MSENRVQQRLQQKEATIVWFNYMDNLRAIALVLGVFFHAAIAYSPISQKLWPASNPVNSMALEFGALFSHTFRMPLFFLISGFFAHMLLKKRGVIGFIKNRLKRILLPFLVFLPLVIASLVGGMLWAAQFVEMPSPFLESIIPTALDPLNIKPDLPFSTGHLWFLYNLFMFCCLLALIWLLGPRLLKLSRVRWLYSLITARFLIFLLPCLLVPALCLVTAPYHAPDSLIPELWSFAYFGIFFLLGFLIYAKQQLLDELIPNATSLLFVSLAFYVYFYLEIKDIKMTWDLIYGHQASWSAVPVAAAQAFISVYMSLWCLLVGKKYLDRKNRLLTIISESSYWVYIVHLPILLMIQYALLDIHLGATVEFLISSLLTLSMSIASYYLLIKPTPLVWLLRGRSKS